MSPTKKIAAIPEEKLKDDTIRKDVLTFIMSPSKKIAVIGRNFTHDIIKGINERFPEDDVIIVDKDIPNWEDKLKEIEDVNKYYLKEKQQMSRMAAMAEMMALTLMAAPRPCSDRVRRRLDPGFFRRALRSACDEF